MQPPCIVVEGYYGQDNRHTHPGPGGKDHSISSVQNREPERRDIIQEKTTLENQGERSHRKEIYRSRGRYPKRIPTRLKMLAIWDRNPMRRYKKISNPHSRQVKDSENSIPEQVGE